MRREFTCALIAFFAGGLIAAAQQTIPPTPPPGATTLPPTDKTAPTPDSLPGPYKIGGRISAPVLVHAVEAEFTDEARRAYYQGFCLVGLTVDAQGNPQNLRIVRPLGMGLDEKAMEAIRQYKFKPAMKDGTTPVPVLITVEVDFRLYSGKGPLPKSVPIDAPRFDTVPGNVMPPDLVNYVAPKYTRSAQKHHITGECVIGLTVDIHGVPQNVHVVTSLEPSLDANAVAAVKKWRYTPAIINGSATPFESTIKIKFVPPE